jgi:alpha-L-rhamnosidase
MKAILKSRLILPLGVIAFFIAVFPNWVLAATDSLAVSQLRCEGREDPIGIDTVRPRLGWQLQAADPAARGLQQTAYQILVATSPDVLADGRGDLWDSGRVTSDQTQSIEYAGRPLRTAQRVFWKMRVWDQDGVSSAWSPIAQWTMGVLSSDEWQAARWIALADTNLQSQLLRRDFIVKPGLVRALIHVTGLGHYEMSLNGVKVGDQLLTPGWTDYRKTVLYDTYDVTSMLKAGSNAAGITLANGMYSVQRTRERFNKFAGSMGDPKAIALLRLEYSDGTTEMIVTDARWHGRPGPIIYSNVYGGEDFDARLNPDGWNRPGFIATNWTPLAETTGPGGRLKGLSAAGLPIRAIESLKPVAQREIRPGTTVYDLGQNAPVIPRLSVSGPAGSSVRIIPSELIKDSGEIDDPMCAGKSYWTYILAGQGSESWFPQFFYRGGRYLQVELRPASCKPRTRCRSCLEWLLRLIAAMCWRRSLRMPGRTDSLPGMSVTVTSCVHWRTADVRTLSSQ